MIREELGEESVSDMADEYGKKLEQLDAPAEVKEKLTKEISRYRSMSSSSAESPVLGTYIETLLALP